MSTKKKAAASTGIRYTAEQKAEIVKFVTDYNSANGRGGQNAASKKYNVTPLTISSWLKASGNKPSKATKAAKAPKAAKVAKAPKAAKVAKAAKTAKAAKASAPAGGSKSPKGMRYTPEQKKEVVDFVIAHNNAHGRGGQSQAAEKFNLSVLTVSSWLKKVGLSAKMAKGPKTGQIVKTATPAAPTGLTKQVASLIGLSDQIRKASAELDALRSKYESLKASIRASI